MPAVGLPRAQRVLARAAWVVAAAYFGGSLAGAADPWQALLRSSDSDSGLLLTLAVAGYFLVLLGRLVVAARADPDRARPLLALAAGVLVYAVGAGSVAAAGPADRVRYPAPGEVLMLAAYLGLAAQLFLRPGRHRWNASGAALDTVIIVGGSLCVSGTALLSPVAGLFGRNGVPLLIALLSPTLDLTLALVTAGQVASGVRVASGAALRVGAGFLAIGAGDVLMTRYMASGTYGKGLLVDACLCAGFGLLVSGAVAAAAEQRRADAAADVTADITADRAADRAADLLRRSPRGSASAVTLLAAASSVVALVLRPGGTSGRLLAGLAVLTLAAVGGRLVLALHEATGAAEARRLSRTDDLTGLPNRRALHHHLAHLPAGTVRSPSLLLLDLDGFKEINDTLGHAAGDAVLTVIGRRLAAAPTGAVLAGRLGGDEFALVLDHDRADDLAQTAHAVRALVRKPVDVDGLELTVDCSIGVAVGGTDDSDGPLGPRELLRRADVSMYQAKAGRQGVALYDPQRDDFSRRRLELSQELAHGIAAGELVTWYQPQVDARTREVVCVEALVRWQHPTRGLVPPAEFLPVARRAGLMPALTEVVIRRAVDDVAGWHALGLEVGLAINVAPSELLSEPVMTALVSHVREVGLSPRHVVVEVTEDSFLAQPDRALEVILGLRAQGLQVSIDDYGTGFSSLAYLKSLPVHEIKVDRSFVCDLLVDPRASVIVTSTVTLAQGLDLRVVAEGVEDEDVARALADLGVDLLQGYHLGRPVPAADVPALLRARHGARSVVGGAG